MKRWMFRICVFVLLGAIVNVTVAWAICQRSSRIEHRLFLAQTLNPVWTSQSSPVTEAFDWNAYGLPFHALQQDNQSLNEATFRVQRLSWNGGLRLDSPRWLVGLGPLALPLRPIWPGFAINTVFYAAVLWGLFAAPFALRRRLRRKRGLCPKCAYPVGTSDVCTECGTSRAVNSPSEPLNNRATLRRFDGISLTRVV